MNISNLRRGDIIRHLATGDGWEVVSDAKQDNLGWTAHVRREITCSNPNEWEFVARGETSSVQDQQEVKIDSIAAAELRRLFERMTQVRAHGMNEQQAHIHLKLMLRIKRRLTVIGVLIAVIAALLAADVARAATSDDVEREIAGAFERSEFSAAEQWALAGMVLADIAGNALGEVLVCQQAHAELIRCVEQFNFDHGR